MTTDELEQIAKEQPIYGYMTEAKSARVWECIAEAVTQRHPRQYDIGYEQRDEAFAKTKNFVFMAFGKDGYKSDSPVGFARMIGDGVNYFVTDFDFISRYNTPLNRQNARGDIEREIVCETPRNRSVRFLYLAWTGADIETVHVRRGLAEEDF